MFYLSVLIKVYYIEICLVLKVLFDMRFNGRLTVNAWAPEETLMRFVGFNFRCRGWGWII